ncbi:MAG: enoyl-CoA hydratase/isomerase family protein [Bdellovibrionales bacterium]|nr:enoyl-CoA hydratase/isomerase family protein [Bdellovibrionales bacterium]
MIEVQKHELHWQITLNRPEVHNAFHPEMIKMITATYVEAAKAKVKLVVLNGNGKSFSAGADLNWMKSMAQYSEKENYVDALKLFDMFWAIYNCPAVTVCVAHGNVFGGGLGFVASSDIAIAEENTKFCFSEVKWGLSPATISPFVRAKVSEAAANHLMLTADIFSAEEARQTGLLYRVVNQETLQASVKQITKNILENGAGALMVTKEL